MTMFSLAGIQWGRQFAVTCLAGCWLDHRSMGIPGVRDSSRGIRPPTEMLKDMRKKIKKGEGVNKTWKDNICKRFHLPFFGGVWRWVPEETQSEGKANSRSGLSWKLQNIGTIYHIGSQTKLLGCSWKFKLWWIDACNILSAITKSHQHVFMILHRGTVYITIYTIW